MGNFIKSILTRRAFAASALIGATGVAKLAAQPSSEKLLKRTPGQALGPFYPVNRMSEADADLTRLAGHDQRAAGEVIELMGRVVDKMGNPVSGAKLEVWQANTHGRYLHANDTREAAPIDPNFQGFADIRTDKDGEWKITTIRPGLYGSRARHIHFDVRGAHDRFITQMYFPEEEARNAADGGLRRVGDRASLLLAHKVAPSRYQWEIVVRDPSG